MTINLLTFLVFHQNTCGIEANQKNFGTPVLQTGFALDLKVPLYELFFPWWK